MAPEPVFAASGSRHHRNGGPLAFAAVIALFGVRRRQGSPRSSCPSRFVSSLFCGANVVCGSHMTIERRWLGNSTEPGLEMFWGATARNGLHGLLGCSLAVAPSQAGVAGRKEPKSKNPRPSTRCPNPANQLAPRLPRRLSHFVLGNPACILEAAAVWFSSSAGNRRSTSRFLPPATTNPRPTRTIYFAFTSCIL